MERVLDVEQLAQAVISRTEGGDPIDRLAVAVAVADEVRDGADALLDQFVLGARDAGRSWAEIGRSLGVSKQAAQQRFTLPIDEGGARELVGAAEARARTFKHRYAGTEHLLLALIGDDGLAGTTLARLGLDEQSVTEPVLERLGQGHSAAPGMSPAAKRALDAAAGEARRLGHRCVAGEHVLLAVSGASDCGAAQILRAHGVTDADVREQLAALLQSEAPQLAQAIRQPPRRRRRVRRNA